jgi:methionyl-tRNA formyltransferase
MHNPADVSIVFMGTPDFAVEPLKAILDGGYKVDAVVTSPDKPAGRGQKVSKSAVKQFAEERNLKVLQPTNLKDSSFIDVLKRIGADIFIVIAFRMLPKSVWSIPPLGTFNLHASLLPQYRGAAPINWAVINGESKTGLTTFLIDDKIDTGNIILREEVEILPNETAGELHDKLMTVGGLLVVQTIEMLTKREIEPQPQQKFINCDNEELKSAPKLFKETTRINWKNSAIQTHNFIRGLSPYPCAWSELIDRHKNKIAVKVYKSEIIDADINKYETGEIITDGKSFFHVQTGQGIISIQQIQLAGKRRLGVREFLVGFKGLENFSFFNPPDC